MIRMNEEDLARETAEQLRLLDGAELRPMDSLDIVDFVNHLETRGVSVPNAALRPENFESLDAIATMLRDLNDR